MDAKLRVALLAVIPLLLANVAVAEEERPPNMVIGLGWLRRAEFNPSGSLMATLSDTSLHVWGLNGSLVAIYASPKGLPLMDVAWSPHGSMIAVSDCLAQVTILRIPYLSPILTLGDVRECHTCEVGRVGAGKSIAWSPNGSWIAHTWPDGSLDLFDLDTGGYGSIRLSMGSGEIIRVWNIEWSPDGMGLLMGFTPTRPESEITQVLDLSEDLSKDPSKGPVLLKLRGGLGIFSPDGSMIATRVTSYRFPPPGDLAQRFYSVVIYHSDNGSIVNYVNTSSSVRCLDWSPDGSHLAVATSKGRIITLGGKGWGIVSNVSTGTLKVGSMSWKGSHLALTLDDQTVELWFVDSGWGVTGPVKTFTGWGSTVRSVSWYPDREYLLSTPEGCGEPFRIYNGDGSLSLQIEGRSDDCRRLDGVVSCNGEMLATSSDSWVVEVWDARYGTLVTLLDLAERARSLHWSPRPGVLVVTQLESLLLWDVLQGSVVTRLVLPNSTCLSWFPGGEVMAVGFKNRFEVWDPWTPSLLSVTPTLGEVLSLAWSPDGLKLVSRTGSKKEYIEDMCGSQLYMYLWAGSITVWDVHGSPQPLYDLSFQGDPEKEGNILPNALVWSPNSTMVALAKGSIMFWISVGGGPMGGGPLSQPDITVWRLGEDRFIPVMELIGPVRPILSLAWSPDSSRIAAGSKDGTIRIWRVGPSQHLTEIPPPIIPAIIVSILIWCGRLRRNKPDSI